jgi:Zn-finger nucleic acid-binding protein
MIRVCPKCHQALFVVRFKEIELDFCSKCRGIWLDAGELEELMNKTGAVVSDPFKIFQTKAASKKNKKHLCPRCDQSLDEIDISQGNSKLTLDRCPKGHGLWFDAHELQDLFEMYPVESHAGATIQALNELFPKKSQNLTAK